ncbi:MAG: EAL domain-containing protein [Rhodospirillaceae bacterium]|nr:EAL domain-containing protein [Rhodospirillaceae bacterium]MBT4486671.1 EAL domain-containing protein [Rhodospirillaceae bacterium]MBT5191091.1 EAL domain-containing protein [Rhodospirillaceae bacterium]
MSNNEIQSTEVRRDRDRFVAFAFSAADAFVELDDEQKIRYATGAIKTLINMDGGDLVGQNFLDLIVPDDRAMMAAGCEMAVKQGRCGPLRLRLLSGTGDPLRLELRGTYLPINGGGLFLSLNRGVANQGAVTDLMDKEGFADAAHEAIKAARRGDRPAVMTMLDLRGLDDLMARMDESDAADLMTDINANIQARAIAGETAGRFDNDKFGVVHDPDVDIPALEDAIGARALEADPEGEGIKVHSASIALDGDELSDFDDAKALLYTINKFSEERSKFTIKDLQQGYKLMLNETRAKIVTFKNVVASGEFDVYYQPVVELETRDVHHYEALVRLHSGGPEDSPFRFITFAEDAGVIAEFDLAMCARVMRFLESIKKQERELSVAVNLSGRSLESPAFLQKLIQLLGHFTPPRSWLQFEITESSTIHDLEATNAFLKSLRELGHAVCLDDFGSGSSAFQYLNALDVDCVKIDGIYVQEAQASAKGKAFIRSIATLCKDLGIDTVGEMVETDASADFLREVGVRYGQGYLFGKPTKDISGWRPSERVQTVSAQS